MRYIASIPAEKLTQEREVKAQGVGVVEKQPQRVPEREEVFQCHRNRHGEAAHRVTHGHAVGHCLVARGHRTSAPVLQPLAHRGLLARLAGNEARAAEVAFNVSNDTVGLVHRMACMHESRQGALRVHPVVRNHGGIAGLQDVDVMRLVGDLFFQKGHANQLAVEVMAAGVQFHCVRVWHCALLFARLPGAPSENPGAHEAYDIAHQQHCSDGDANASNQERLDPPAHSHHGIPDAMLTTT
mmetsp:Transcript_60934/g.170430  ORF Transcript_60934/g.170430 Transcript_60934/m.170430 type:complete len:241 (+) Transcript_60934:428-1150(+)